GGRNARCTHRFEHRDGPTARHTAWCRAGDRGGDRFVARHPRQVHQRRSARRGGRYRSGAAGEAACVGACLSAMHQVAAAVPDAPRLDVRLVPTAMTSWLVTAAGIIWPVGPLVAALCLVLTAASAVLWGRAERDRRDRLR